MDRDDFTGRVVLVVDDEADMLSLLAMLLEESLPGARVVAVPTGLAALDVLRQGGVDVVVTDYKLPDVDGIEVLRRVKAQKVGRIVLTAYADSSLASRARQDGQADYFFTKPVEPNQVLDAVRDLLRRGRTPAGSSSVPRRP